jgi:hypothetical protein
LAYAWDKSTTLPSISAPVRLRGPNTTIFMESGSSLEAVHFRHRGDRYRLRQSSKSSLTRPRAVLGRG